MKKIKIYLSLLVAVGFQQAAAQDIQLNILGIPATVTVGQTANILVDICNVDPNPITAPADKIRTLVSTSPAVTITGVSDVNGNPLTGWTVLSLGTGPGNSVRLEYDLPMANADCGSFHINLLAVAVGTANLTGTLQWNGPQTPGNNIFNDNSISAVVVTVPLPVTFSSFTAQKQGCTAVLDWTTDMEYNNSYFAVERSPDGRNFTTLAQVAAAGNSTERKSYSYTDSKPAKGLNQYRIRQVDIDGKSNTTTVKSLDFDCRTNTVQVYPTPTKGAVYVELPAGYEHATIKVYSLLGQELDIPATGMAGSGTHALQFDGLAQGQYLIRVANGNDVQTFKVVYQH